MFIKVSKTLVTIDQLKNLRLTCKSIRGQCRKGRNLNSLLLKTRNLFLKITIK